MISSDIVYFNTLVTCNEDCVQLFHTNLEKYVNKFPNAKFKQVIKPLIDNRLITIGYPEKYKNLLLGQVLYTYDKKIAAIAINSITHDIDRDGNSMHFDQIVSSMYYILLESILGSSDQQKPKLLADTQLLSKISHYYEYVFLKSLKLIELHAEKQLIARLVIRYFFYRFLCNKNSVISYDTSITELNNENLRSLVAETTLSKYKSIIGVFDCLYDIGVIKVPPNNLKYIMTNSIGILSFIALTTELSQCVAAFVLSKYKHPNFAKLFISAELVNKIEDRLVSDYLTQVSIDIEAFSKKYVDWKPKG